MKTKSSRNLSRFRERIFSDDLEQLPSDVLEAERQYARAGLRDLSVAGVCCY